jgi:polysaccharide biosynthesis protein PslH
VDTEYFQPVAKPPDEPTVGFTGDMSYFPNAEAVTYFAQKVLPVVRRSVPGTRFLIIGRNPGPKVRALAEIDGVDVTGFVPDVREYLARMQVAVAPFSIAAGIQNKILEAMASGIPVVCTSRTAQGLSAEVADAVEVADGTQKMAAATVDLLRQPELARIKGMHGRTRVAAAYRWDRSLERLLQLVEHPTGQESAPSAYKSLA